MKKSAKPDPLAERPNLDFSKGVRGKYVGMLRQETGVVVLEPSLRTRFPDSESVNRALRALVTLTENIAPKTIRRRRPAA